MRSALPQEGMNEENVSYGSQKSRAAASLRSVIAPSLGARQRSRAFAALLGASLVVTLLIAVPARAVAPVNGQIAFGTDGRIFRIDPDGSSLEVFTGGRDPKWSGDGTVMVFSRNNDIYSIRATDGYLERDLSAKSYKDEDQPAISPAGTRILFRRGGSIWKMNSAGTGRVNLSKGTTDQRPVWSPDGTKIAFQRVEATCSTIWLMNPDGTGQTPITPCTDGETDADPAFSPDGGRIAYSYQGADYDQTYPTFDIRTINVDGSDIVTIVCGCRTPAYSPDGTLIVANAWSPEEATFGTISVNGGSFTPLATLNSDSGVHFESVPSWGPVPPSTCSIPAPAVLKPHVYQPSGLGENGIDMPVRLAWDPSQGTGITYRVQGTEDPTLDGKLYYSATVALTAGTNADLSLRFGPTNINFPPQSYRVRAETSTCASPWTESPTFRIDGFEEIAASLTGSWATKSSANYWDTRAKATTAAGASATFTFTGSNVAVIGTIGPKNGSFRMYVDGSSVGTGSANGSTAKYQQVIMKRGWNSVGTHTIRLENLASAGHPSLVIDGFVVLGAP
jgi:WD40-like Beta Propeller Repeat